MGGPGPEGERRDRHVESNSDSNPTGQLVAEHPAAGQARPGGLGGEGCRVHASPACSPAPWLFASFGWSPTASTQEASPNGRDQDHRRITGRGAAAVDARRRDAAVRRMAGRSSALMPGRHDAESTVKRIGYVVSAVIYTTFAITAIALARRRPADRDANAEDGNAKVTNLTARLMGHGGGRLLIGAIGVIVIGAGALPPREGAAPGRRRRAGSLGHVAGADPVDATTRRRRRGRPRRRDRRDRLLPRCAPRSTSIRTKRPASTVRCGASSPRRGGVVVVAVIALGFIAYGMFCLATFTRRRLEAP